MNIRNQLTGTEEEIPEKRIVSQIYISLPSEYDSLIKVIKYGPREQQTLDNVINTLMEEKNSKNNKLVAKNAGSSLTSRSTLIAYSCKNNRGHGGS
jgi:dynactin complex subunit